METKFLFDDSRRGYQVHFHNKKKNKLQESCALLRFKLESFAHREFDMKQWSYRKSG